MTGTPHPSRRRFLKLSGATAAALTVGAGAAAADDGGWTVAETPTGNTLYDVERTVDGLYAVDAGGIVLQRTAAGWETVLDGGPTDNGNSLYGADVTDDGSTLWFVGASGAIGEYDVVSGGGGSVYEWEGAEWVRNDTGDAGLRDVEDCDTGTVTVGGGGAVFRETDGTWRQGPTPTGENLNAGPFEAAVGAGGTVIERD